MIVTREVDYMLRILRALYQEPLQSATQIAREERIPQAVTYKLLRRLSQEGIVEGIRGKNGGYQLLVSCEDLTLYHFLQAIDEEPVMNQCLVPGYSCGNNNCEQCKIHKELDRVGKNLKKDMMDKTLAQLFS